MNSSEEDDSDSEEAIIGHRAVKKYQMNSGSKCRHVSSCSSFGDEYRPYYIEEYLTNDSEKGSASRYIRTTNMIMGDTIY